MSRQDELGSVKGRVRGKGTTKLRLTPTWIFVNAEGGWLGEEEVSIPLSSLDAITVGWKRYSVLLLIGVGLAVGALFPGMPEPTMLVGALIFGGAFFMIRPGHIEIRAGEEKVRVFVKNIRKAAEFVARVERAALADEM